ncbi:hypothetical protein [Psychroflexus aestuariivivens]|uniref:hypothetical protein n=1 Tax=Psychroflexus aestuariivivens TaxID=1795040 RepID=UPI000FDBF26A|nr:hypothetical protein [Psychroflexus aestuariivivens]
MSGSKTIWWGYVHENGSIQVKRYFNDADIQDAIESPFVGKVISRIEVPVDVKNHREYAEEIANIMLR